MSLNPAKFRASLTKRGWIGTATYSATAAIDTLRWSIDSWFDRIHNVDTSGKIRLSELNVRSANAAAATWYEPSPTSCFRQLMQNLPINFSDYVFVDYGSGKGRVTLLAADHPFRRVIGVEFSRELHEIAVRNIRTYRSRRRQCQKIEPVCVDAVDYELPPEPAVLFFYSPFNAAVLETILEQVKGSLRRHPRSLYILYLGDIPEPIALLKKTGLLCSEIKLRRDYFRGVTKRGLILHSGVQNPADKSVLPLKQS